MSQIHKHTIPANIADRCLINPQQYEAMYQQSINVPDTFWGEQGKILDWIKPYQKVKNTSFAPGNVSIKWYEDGTLNLAANCLDRHLQENGDRTAIIWEGDDASQSKHISYKELHRDVCRFANTLLELGIKKGDVVAIYMPMVPEAAVAMLACARIGAVHSVIFGGFSPEAVAGRIIDSNSRLVITSDEGVRAGRSIPLKKNVDDALKNPNVTSVEHVVVLKRTGGKIDWQEGRDLWWHDLVEQASDQHQAEEMNAEDPLFILYTSGSTGKPKGVLHTTGGYLVIALFAVGGRQPAFGLSGVEVEGLQNVRVRKLNVAGAFLVKRGGEIVQLDLLGLAALFGGIQNGAEFDCLLVARQ